MGINRILNSKLFKCLK